MKSLARCENVRKKIQKECVYLVNSLKKVLNYTLYVLQNVQNK